MRAAALFAALVLAAMSMSASQRAQAQTKVRIGKPQAGAFQFVPIDVGLETGIPVTFGVLTVDTDEQAMARSVPGPENKGFHAAQSAVEMVQVLRGLR